MAQPLITDSQAIAFVTIATGARRGDSGRWVAAESLVRKGLVQKMGSGAYTLTPSGLEVIGEYKFAVAGETRSSHSMRDVGRIIFGVYKGYAAALRHYQQSREIRDEADVFMGTPSEAAAWTHKK